MNQEQLFRLQMIEQEANQINQQLEIVEQNISEMNELKSSLEELEKPETKEFLANLGKKIFIPVEIKEKKLVVEVGNKNFVKKTIPETKKLVEEQLEKLEMVKVQLAEKVESLQCEMNHMIIELNKSSKEHKQNCNHKECECEEECEDCECEEERGLKGFK